MPIFVTQPPMVQLRHLQWLLVLLMLVALVLLVSSFSTVSGFSIHPPILFLQSTSFSHVIFKQDENAYIFHIYIHFCICIHIHICNHFHIPIHPIHHPSTTCNISTLLECTADL